VLQTFAPSLDIHDIDGLTLVIFLQQATSLCSGCLHRCKHGRRLKKGLVTFAQSHGTSHTALELDIRKSHGQGYIEMLKAQVVCEVKLIDPSCVA
jgi:hypothetical protein